MKIIETPVFTLSELSPKAKDRARAWFRSGGLWDSEAVIEDAKQCLRFAGLTVDNVYFSGFSSQGDGACFEGSWYASAVSADGMKQHAPQDARLHQIAEEFARIAALFPHAYFSVKHSGHYSHHFCTNFTISIVDENDDEIRTNEADAVKKDLIEVARDAMQWIYRQLEKDYDWYNEDAQVDEMIEANEYTFTEDGERFG